MGHMTDAKRLHNLYTVDWEIFDDNILWVLLPQKIIPQKFIPKNYSYKKRLIWYSVVINTMRLFISNEYPVGPLSTRRLLCLLTKK